MACTSARIQARTDARSARGLGWLAVAAVAGLIHAGFSAYWALGGTWLLETVGEQVVEAFSGALWFIGLVACAKLLAAVLPLAVEAVRSMPGWLRGAIRLVSWLGALGIILWGGYGMIAAQLALAGALGTVADTSIPALIGHAWIWDPLFLVWGLALLIGLVRSRGPRLAGGLQPDRPESQPRPRPVS
ncbi:hypothetical protein USB125703_01925 [Pseudoclavibacter triregionum]|nr:hypothetical protein USB125703_01925 [Pseudoclavibacter triregionum]